MIFSTYSILATCTSRSWTIGTGTWRTCQKLEDEVARDALLPNNKRVMKKVMINARTWTSRSCTIGTGTWRTTSCVCTWGTYVSNRSLRNRLFLRNFDNFELLQNLVAWQELLAGFTANVMNMYSNSENVKCWESRTYTQGLINLERPRKYC